jgi:hypothetical protein
MKQKKTWKEKLLDSKDLPKVIKIKGKMAKRWGIGTCVIPSPIEVNEIMKRVPNGKLITINEICYLLAKKHNSSISCPITTGIFAWISANAAQEAMIEGKKRITPYWRTLKTNGELNPKYPAGLEKMAILLKKEGHTIIHKGKRIFVEDFKKKLVEI